MSDRAVVDDTVKTMCCTRCGYEARAAADWEPTGCPSCTTFQKMVEVWDNAPIPDPHPRALCAISEDRQWLVVQELGGWIVYRWVHYGYKVHEDVGQDTGQSADEVLAQWLEGRE